MPFTPTLDKLEISIEVLLDTDGVYHLDIVANSQEGKAYSHRETFRDQAFGRTQVCANSALTLGLNALAKQLRTHQQQ